MDGNEMMKESASNLTVDSLMRSVQPESRSGVLTAALPTGYLDDDGNLHTAVDIRPYTGEEEDILASQNMPMYRRMAKMLENCTLRIGDYSDPKRIKQALRALPFSDRLYLIIQIRIATNGPIYSFETQCPECKRKAMQNVDLNEIKFAGLADPLKRQFSCKLDGTGAAVTWNVMDGGREEKIHQYSIEKDLLSVGIFARLNDIDGKRVTMEMIKKMTAGQRRRIRAEFDKHEGKIDQSVTFQCPHCDHEWADDVEYAHPSFFFPTDV